MEQYLKIYSAGVFDSIERFVNQNKTGKRKVKTYELELFTQDGGIANVNNVEYPITKGGVLFIKPGDVRFSILHFKCKFIHFEIVNEELQKCFEKMQTYTETDAYNEIKLQFENIILNCFAENYLQRFSAYSELILLLNKLANVVPYQKTAGKAGRYISDHCLEDLNMKNIAKHLNISISHLHKIFSEEYGIGPIEFLIKKRIEHAKMLLLSTNLSVSEISAECGYNSQSYFSYAFKKATGLSPLEFKRQSEYLILDE